MMQTIFLFALAGFLASFVDGALGMGFGPTSSSILLITGLTPTAVSASVNLAKVATGLAAAISHWRFRNIDHQLVLRLAIPGSLGAIIGVTVLSNVDGQALRPILALLLSVIGLRILARFSRQTRGDIADKSPDVDPNVIPPYNAYGVEFAATLGGITNGMIGAWGPVVTPFLLHRGLQPRYAVGSVNTAEVAVALTSAVALVISTGRDGFNISIVLAMLVAGVIAAPIAAWVIRHIPAAPLGVAVAALLLITNARELSIWARLDKGPYWRAAYVGVFGIIVMTLLVQRWIARRR